MAEVKHGTVQVTAPDRLVPPEKAGKMSAREVRRRLKEPHGLGLAASSAAYAMERAGANLAAPQELTPNRLREAGDRSEEMAQVLKDLEVVVKQFRQASLLCDAEAYQKLRQLNDLVKAQARYRPQLRVIFQSLLHLNPGENPDPSDGLRHLVHGSDNLS